MSDQDQSDDQTPQSVLTDPTEFFEALDKGSLGDQLCERIQSMVNRVRETGRKGKVKLEFHIKLSGADQVQITPAINTNAPKREYQDSLFYTDDESHLYRQDPDQMTINFRSPEGADAETRDSVNRN